jgi:hypothetical protein
LGSKEIIPGRLGTIGAAVERCAAAVGGGGIKTEPKDQSVVFIFIVSCLTTRCVLQTYGT